MPEKRRRRTFAEVIAAARAERDIEVAAFLDGYADLVEKGPRKRESWEHAVNQIRIPEECRGSHVVALRGLASSIRAGLVE